MAAAGIPTAEVSPAPAAELAVCQALRMQVFVRGQGVPEALEIDGLDAEASHWLARVDGQPAGTARLRVVEGLAKAERVAVLERFRGAGVGAALMRALEGEARRRGLDQMVLHAQVRVIPFYERLGYAAHGPVFDDAGIPHRAMCKRLVQAGAPAP